MASSAELLLRQVSAARERALRARSEARASAEVAWRQRCDALLLRMRARELGPPLHLRVSPEKSELKRLRERVREYAAARGADPEAVVLAAHEAVAYALCRVDRMTEPIEVEVCRRRGALELRVRAGVAGAAGVWDAVESTGLRLIAEFSDRFEIPFRPQGGLEIRASFSIGRP
jgi:hypothetical protein